MEQQFDRPCAVAACRDCVIVLLVSCGVCSVKISSVSLTYNATRLLQLYRRQRCDFSLQSLGDTHQQTGTLPHLTTIRISSCFHRSIVRQSAVPTATIRVRLRIWRCTTTTSQAWTVLINSRARPYTTSAMCVTATIHRVWIAKQW